jgi:2-keto-4-pentenoate hydratase
MTSAFDAERAARHVLAAHDARQPYRNLPAEIAPQTMTDAYAVQEALGRLLVPREGEVAGLKIAVATKVMQEFMGIDRPLGGMIFKRRILRSPARLRLADYMNVVIEFELAVELGRDLPKSPAPFTAATVMPAVAAVMPAFELIEDRNADYKTVDALSLICDNCWNGGIVLGPPVSFSGQSLSGVLGRLEINGKEQHRGATDDPLATLAWIANLAAERGRPLRAGMVVITGSVIATLPIKAGDRFVFHLDALGGVELTAT